VQPKKIAILKRKNLIVVELLIPQESSKKEEKKRKKKATRSPSNYLMIRCYLNLMKDKIQKKKSK